MGYPTPPPWPQHPEYPQQYPEYPQQYPPYPPMPPQRSAVDVTVSIVAMVLTLLVGAAGTLMALFSLGFLDNCPPETCSVEAAVTASLTTVVVAGVVVLIGLILTIIRLASRKQAWPFALGTFGLCAAVFVLGGFAYGAAAG